MISKNMPEGPECRIMAEQLNKIALNKPLTHLVPLDPTAYNLKKNDPDVYQKLIGLTVEQVKSYGKLIYLTFYDSKLVLIITMGMTGTFSTKSNVYNVISMTFDQDKVYYQDRRKFGSFLVSDIEELFFKLSDLGQNLFELNLLKLVGTIRAKQTKMIKPKNICKLLMDQTIVAGIGNYIKSEALHEAKVNPLLNLQDLSDEQLIDLYKAAARIALESYNMGGVSIEDFVHMDGSTGSFSSKFKVYGRRQDPDGNEVTRIVTPDLRATWYVK